MLTFFLDLALLIAEASISLSIVESSSYWELAKLAKLDLLEALKFGRSIPKSLDGNNLFIRGILNFGKIKRLGY